MILPQNQPFNLDLWVVDAKEPSSLEIIISLLLLSTLNVAGAVKFWTPLPSVYASFAFTGLLELTEIVWEPPPPTIEAQPLNKIALATDTKSILFSYFFLYDMYLFHNTYGFYRIIADYNKKI